MVDDTFERINSSSYSNKKVYLSNPNIAAFLTKINNNTVTEGVIELFNDKYAFPSFNRAMGILSNPKTGHDLQAAEASLQTTITEIREFNKNGSKHFDDKKTSLYLFALQNMILHLGEIELLGETKNTYAPQLVSSLQNLSTKCTEFGIDLNVMRSQCLSTEYQQPNNPDLRNFKFIDVNRVNAFERRLKKYMVTSNADDLYEHNVFPQLPTTSQFEMVIQKLIVHIEYKFKIKKLDFAFYQKHQAEITNEINTLFVTADPHLVRYLNEEFANYLQTKEQGKNQIFTQNNISTKNTISTQNNDDRTM